MRLYKPPFFKSSKPTITKVFLKKDAQCNVFIATEIEHDKSMRACFITHESLDTESITVISDNLIERIEVYTGSEVKTLNPEKDY